jgi:hypothetical protein
MADTGAPWNIPYAEPSDLVRDWPALSEDVADAVADGLDAVLGIGIGQNVVQTVKTDTFTTASTSFVDVTGFNVTITPSSTSSKVLVIAQFTISSTGSRSAGNSYGISARLRRGSTDIYIGDAASNRTRASYGIGPWNAEDYFPASIIFLDSPNTAGATTYGLQVAHPTNTQTQSVCIGRSGTDSNDNQYSRHPSSFTAIEVAG